MDDKTLLKAIETYQLAVYGAREAGAEGEAKMDPGAVADALGELRIALGDAPSPADEHAARSARLAEVLGRDSLAGDDLRDAVRAAIAGKMPTARAVAAIADPLPAPVLRLAGQKGALLTRGSVGVLAGEGGTGKSALTCGLAVDVVGAGHDAGPLVAATPGPVLIASWEDDAGAVAWRVRQYAHLAGAQRAHQDVYVLVLSEPIFGPVANASGAALYNARPGRLPMWAALEAEAKTLKPALTIIDPALAAYCADSNTGAPVREFLRALGTLAGDGAVLVVAHSTKAARGRKTVPDPFDPGMVAGSSHWTDGVRGVVSLSWRPELQGERDMACPKANYGPARLVCGLETLRTDSGAVVGFARQSDWHAPKPAPGDDDGKAETGDRGFD